MFKRFLVLVTAFFLITLAHDAFAKGENIVKMGRDVEISRDMVVDNVVTVDGNITVFGKVESNVVAVGGTVTLKPKSYVGHEVVIVGGNLIKDPMADIGGKITQIDVPHFIPSFTTFLKGGWIALWATISILVLLGFLGLTILLVALIPEHIGTAVNALERSFIPMFLWGLLWMVLIVPVAVLLAISIVGIILIPLEILLVALALVIGYITSAAFIGKSVFLSFKQPSAPFVDAIVGILILFLIGFVPIIGALIRTFFLIAGFGAVLTTRFGTLK